MAKMATRRSLVLFRFFETATAIAMPESETRSFFPAFGWRFAPRARLRDGRDRRVCHGARRFLDLVPQRLRFKARGPSRHSFCACLFKSSRDAERIGRLREQIRRGPGATAHRVVKRAFVVDVHKKRVRAGQ